jgi:exosome complex exonuclease DIS3/RRP44
LKTGLGDSESEDILIPGRVLRNRAVDGDLVAVQLLPKSEWKSKINRLGMSTANDKDDEDEEKWERRAGEDFDSVALCYYL